MGAAATSTPQANISEGTELLEFAKAYRVDDQDSADAFAEWRNGLKVRKAAAIIEQIGDEKADAYKHWKDWCDLEAEIVKPYDTATKVADEKLIAYRNQQRRRSEIWHAAEQAENRRKEEEHRLAVAAQQEAAGQRQAAEATITEPIAPVSKPPPEAKVKGMAFPETWVFVLDDKAAFVKAVGANPDLLHLVDANLPALNALARAQKDMLDIPGGHAEKKEGASKSTTRG
jgi:hypothetical protein